MQLSQVIDGFFIVRRTRLAPTTQTNYRYCFQRLTNFLGPERDFASITATDIRAFIDHLQNDGLSDRSVHDNLAICSALWTFAESEFKLLHVVKEVEKPAYNKKEIIPFTENEIKTIIDVADWTAHWDTRLGKNVRSKRPTWRRDLAIIVLLLDTGLRVSEMCKLKIGDYQQENGRLMVRHGKGNKQRPVFLGATAQRVLWRYLMSRDRIKPADPIFVTRYNKPLHRTYVLHLMGRFGENAGVVSVHPHRFRHTFAIQFLRNGGNVFELQRILGHVDLETVKIYVNLAQVDIERAQKAHSPADNWRL